ncbi:hypothetical protein B0187_09235, partial [Haemophilus paracuniculus]
MNKVFKVIWNQATQSWVAVSELTKAKGKSASSTDERAELTSADSKFLPLLVGGLLSLSAPVAFGAAATEYSVDNSITKISGGTDSVLVGTNLAVNGVSNNLIGSNIQIGRSGTSVSYSTAIGGNVSIQLGPYGGSRPGNNYDGPGHVAIGYGAQSHGYYGNTIVGSQSGDTINSEFSAGQVTVVGSRSYAYGDQSNVFGSDARALGNSSYAVGGDDIEKARAQLAQAIPEYPGTNGRNLKKLYVERNPALATKTVIGGTTSLIEGQGRWTQTVAGGDVSTAIGAQAQTAGVASQALGVNALAIGNASIAMGAYATAGGIMSNPTTVTDSSGRNAIAIGTASNATTADAVALGHAARAFGQNSTAIGSYALSQGNDSIAFGTYTNVTGHNSVALGPNIRRLSTENSVVLGQASTEVLTNGDVESGTLTSGASHAVTKVKTATVKNSSGEDITYGEWGFAGQPQTTGQYVSIGEKGNERQLKNVAAGHIDAQSTDGINGSQLYAVMAKVESGFVVSNNTVNATNHITPNKIVNFNNGTATTATVANWNSTDGSVAGVNVTFNVNTTPLTVSDGSSAADSSATVNKAPSGKVDTPVDQNAIATAGDVANAINNAGWWTNATNPDGTSNNTLINPGDIVNFAKGSNLKLTQTNTTDANGVDTVTYTYSVVDTPTFTNVTIGNASNPIVIGEVTNPDGSKSNVISNLTSRLPKTVTENTSGTTNDGTGGQGTINFTDKVERPSIDPSELNNAATLSDVLNAG